MSGPSGEQTAANGPTRFTAERLVQFVVGQIELRMLVLLILVVTSLSALSPHFLTTNNILNMMDQAVVVGIIAIGQTLVILIGGIDLSVGSLAGVAGVVLGLALFHVDPWIAALLSVLFGAVFGFVNGAIIQWGRIAPFVVTLGTMSIGRSLAYVLSDATSIDNVPDTLATLSNGTIAGLPINFICLVAAYVVCWWFLTYTKGGRTLYAIGSNREAARVTGLNIAFWSIFAYVVTGVCSGAAAVFLAARLLSIDPIGGTGLELDSIAGVVIGGASLFGGRGSIVGTLAGVFIMVFIRNALNLLNVSAYWQGTAIGSIIIAAVLLERWLSSRSHQ